MKTFLLVATVLVFSCIASGVGVHYYDMLDFEVNFGYSLEDIWKAKAECEEVTMQKCIAVGYFMPKSQTDAPAPIPRNML